jgi:transposase-like protein
MPKTYQIQRQKAIQKFNKLATEGKREVQLILPLVTILHLLQEGVGELMREATVQLMMLVMQEEVRHLVGERSRPDRNRQAYRWGQEDGLCVVDGQKVPVKRLRVRSKQKREVPLGSYELFRREEPLDRAVWEKMTRGISTRDYEAVTRSFAEAYGLEKSTASDHFIRASRAKLQALLERPLGELRLCAILIDGTAYKNHDLIVALGIGCDGRKTVLGLREGATENTTVVSELIGDLVARGLDFSVPRLYVLDGGKALRKAVGRHAGEEAVIQRCQVHKKRNVLDHLAEEHRNAFDRKLSNAYALTEYEDAKRALGRVHRELMDLNPSAARSLEEGLEETLTVHKLRVPALLRKTLASTNVIESAFSVVEKVCRNVKRWHPGDQAERWVASGLLVAEQRFHRVQGYREIPQLVEALARYSDNLSKPGVAKRATVA